MKKLLLLLFLTVTSLYTSFAADTTNVLFIGNSFVYTHNVPQLLKDMATADGEILVFTMHAPGGISVGDVAQGNQAHMNNPVVFDLIRQGNWDYVVVQDNQGRFVGTYGSFPAPTTSKVIEGHVKILDSIKHYNSCARTLWFAGWAFKDGYPGLGTGEALIKNIYNNYRYLNDSTHEIIAPIGSAWLRAINEVPATDLWGPDEAHQSLAGSYLTAAVLHASIYRKNIEDLTFNGGLQAAAAKTYRTIAYETVKDSITKTNLATFIPVLSANGNTLTATNGYARYEWYKDGNFAANTNVNTYTTTGSGRYSVIGITPDSCTQRSMELTVFPASAADINNENLFIAYPNPVTDALYIDAGNAGNEKRIVIRNIAGAVVYSKTFNTAQIKINTREWSAGMYVAELQTKDGIAINKIIKQSK